MRKTTPPSDLELQVLSVLWRNGPCTVRDVLPAMPDGKRRAYTTVLSVMQVMEKKGLLTHTTKGKTHVYRPTVTRRQVVGPMLREMVKNIFGGSPSLVVQQLVNNENLDAVELAAIKKILNDTESHGKKKE